MKYILIVIGVVGVLAYTFDFKFKTADKCRDNPQSCVEVRENAHKLLWD
jgi:hypothetical protein